MDKQQPNLNSQEGSFSYRERYAHRHDIIERIILGVGSFLLVMLAIRFVLALLGVNPSNAFANGIYVFTTPFTAPFYSLFSYDHPTIGISSFEGYTIVAMAVYGLITTGLVRLISVTRY